MAASKQCKHFITIPRKGGGLQKTDPNLCQIISQNVVPSSLHGKVQSSVLILETELISLRECANACMSLCGSACKSGMLELASK